MSNLSQAMRLRVVDTFRSHATGQLWVRLETGTSGMGGHQTLIAPLDEFRRVFGTSCIPTDEEVKAMVKE